MLARSCDLDEIIQPFKDTDVEKPRAARLFAECASVGIREARRIVHLSEAFSYRREADEAPQDAFFEAFETLARER